MDITKEQVSLAIGAAVPATFWLAAYLDGMTTTWIGAWFALMTIAFGALAGWVFLTK